MEPSIAVVEPAAPSHPSTTCPHMWPHTTYPILVEVASITLQYRSGWPHITLQYWSRMLLNSFANARGAK